MNHPKKIMDQIDRLIARGQALLKTDPHGQYVKDREALRRWSNELILLRTTGGQMLAPWKGRLQHSGHVISYDDVRDPLAALETVKYAMENGLLVSYRDLIVAEAFADIYSQGRYLLDAGYYLAAGVLFRAVLEERLRALCTENSCLPVTSRPTINDLSQALYKCSDAQYDKATMLHVTAMAAVGSDAAHNAPTLTREAVAAFADQLLPFLNRYST